jgi:GH43 family beta-xylosidase
VVPEYAWDNTIAEGGNVFVRDGVIYMIYSGSTVGDTYTTGLVTAPAGVDADLSLESTWTKLNYPAQKSSIFNGDWKLGTGHGMWSEDEDGNLLYVFHACTNGLGLTGRDMFFRRVHWAADGMPVFDMTTQEELASGSEQVRMNVWVSADVVPSITLGASSVVAGGLCL